MVIKVAQMGIPVLLSRSGVTQKGLEFAQKIGVTMIARAKGSHFLVYNGAERIVFDAKPTPLPGRPVGGHTRRSRKDEGAPPTASDTRSNHTGTDA